MSSVSARTLLTMPDRQRLTTDSELLIGEFASV